MSSAAIDDLSNRGLVLRFAPAATRAALAALFEIEREVATSLEARLDHGVAHTRLEWWHEELTRLSAAEPRHPATRQLAAALLGVGRTPPTLLGLVAATRIDLACVAFLERSELEEYLDEWSRSVFVTAAGDAAPALIRLGRAVREIELLDEWPRHALRGRIYLPLGDPPAAHQPWLQQPLAAAECAVMQTRLRELQEELRTAAAALASARDLELSPALIWAALAFTQAGNRIRSLPSFADDSRWQALSRTIRAWRAALDCSRQRLPQPLR